MNTEDRILSDERVETEIEEVEKYKPQFTLSESNELFDDEEAAKKHKLISIRRVALPRKGENWEISEDGRKVVILRGVRLTNREKSVLRTPEGIRLIIDEYKAGNRSATKIKSILRDYWKKHNDKV